VRSSLLANQRIGPHIQKNLPDLIDFFFVKNISTNYIKIEEGFDLNSDHSPVYLLISDKIITKDQNPVLTIKHTDWDYFIHLLESNINLSEQLITPGQLERELNAFKTAIQEAAWNSTPVIKTKLKGFNFPKEIRNLIAEKRKLKRKWHQSRNPHDRNLLNRVSQQLSRKSKLSSNHQLTSSSQKSLKTVALTILFGKLVGLTC
jgi:hypothetical protein